MTNAEHRRVQKTSGLAIFCLLYRFIVKLLVKIMPKITLQFESPFKLCFRGRDSGSFFVEEYWPWVGGICKHMMSWCKCPGVRGGQPPRDGR